MKTKILLALSKEKDRTDGSTYREREDGTTYDYHVALLELRDVTEGSEYVVALGYDPKTTNWSAAQLYTDDYDQAERVYRQLVKQDKLTRVSS